MKLSQLKHGDKIKIPNFGIAKYIGKGSGREKNYHIVEEEGIQRTIFFNGDVELLN